MLHLWRMRGALTLSVAIQVADVSGDGIGSILADHVRGESRPRTKISFCGCADESRHWRRSKRGMGKLHVLGVGLVCYGEQGMIVW